MTKGSKTISERIFEEINVKEQLRMSPLNTSNDNLYCQQTQEEGINLGQTSALA